VASTEAATRPQMPLLTPRPLLAALVFAGAGPWCDWEGLAGVAGEEDCESKPGGCRCYYDALADNCPQSLGQDSQVMLCGCIYSDNTWLTVLSNFIAAFRGGAADRASLGSRFSVKLEGNGILSMDVGYTSRVQCGAALAQVYPGTSFEVSVEELHQFARNIFSGEVRQKLLDVCMPGRIALQLLCLHASLAVHDGAGAQAYAAQIANLFPLVEGCVQQQTPFSFPGLGEYLRAWRGVQLPAGGALDSGRVAELTWWPEPGLMRGKMPEESEVHYFPCVPLQDKACFPAGADNLFTSCENCCDPAKGPTGDASCFGGEWTFARCCRTPGGSGRFY